MVIPKRLKELWKLYGVARNATINTRDFFQITQLTESHEGIAYRKKHNSLWGCYRIKTDEELIEEWESGYRKYTDENGEVTQSLRPFPKERYKGSVEKYIEISKNPSVRHSSFHSSTRGFTQEKERFGDWLEECIEWYDEEESKHFPSPHYHIHEGRYYTHFIVTPKTWGVDVMPHDWDQLYFKMGDDGIIRPCEVFEGFQSLMF